MGHVEHVPTDRVSGNDPAGTDPRFEAELRRGVLALVAMHLLDRPRYGYDLVRSLAACGFAVEEGTLYPLLRRLEQQGWVGASWHVAGARPRKYYVLSPEGLATRERMKIAWERVRTATDASLATGLLAPPPTEGEPDESVPGDVP